MKKVLVALLAVCAVGWATMASGPLFGFGVEPVAGAAVSFDFGWGFDTWSIVGEKQTFDAWYGPWGIGALWNPDWGWAQGRVGLELGWIWYPSGIYFEDLAFVLGAQRFWGVAGVYGQLEIGQSTYIIPKVGFVLQFDLPDGTEDGL